MEITCEDIWGGAFLEECTVNAKALRPESLAVWGVATRQAGVLVWLVHHFADIYWAPVGAKPCSGHWGDNGDQLRPRAPLEDLVFLWRDKQKQNKKQARLPEWSSCSESDLPLLCHWPLLLWNDSPFHSGQEPESSWWPAVGTWALQPLPTVSFTSLLAPPPLQPSILPPRGPCSGCSHGRACPSPQNLLDQLLLVSVVPTSTLYLKIHPLPPKPTLSCLISLLFFFLPKITLHILTAYHVTYLSCLLLAKLQGMWILAPWPGFEPMPPAVGARSSCLWFVSASVV